MATEITPCQARQRLVFRQFGHRRNPFFQKCVRAFASSVLATTNDAFLLRTCHKASHTAIVRHNPRTVKVFGNLLFCQTFLSTKNLLQQVMRFRIEFIRDVQIISFAKESFAEIIRCAESFSIQRISSAATRCHVGRIT